MDVFVRTMTLVRRANARFALWFGGVLSWPLWLPLILGGSVIGLTLRQDDIVMLLLTIQTSVDSAATKMLQNHVRNKDEERDQRNDAVLMELQRQARAAVKRDKMIIATLKAQNDLLDFITEGGFERNESSKVKRRTRTDRKGDGHRDRPKP